MAISGDRRFAIMNSASGTTSSGTSACNRPNRCRPPAEGEREGEQVERERQ
jgi:hypothetical protein